MKSSYNKLFLLTALVLLIVGISAVSAADSAGDSDNTATTSDVSTTTSIESTTSNVDSSISTQDTSSSSSDASMIHSTDSSDTSSSDVKSTSSSSTNTQSSSKVDTVSSVKSDTSSVDTTTTKSSDTNDNSANTVNQDIENKKVNSNIDNKDQLKKDTEYTVSSYSELVSCVNSTKMGSDDSIVVNLNPSDNSEDYTITESIEWGDSDGTQIAKVLTINGNGVTLYGSDSRFIYNYNGYTVNVNDITVINSNISGSGAVINNRGNASFTNCNFTNNTASSYGGVYYGLGNLTMENCVIESNTANFGAILYNDGDWNINSVQSTINLINCDIGENTARTSGYYIAVSYTDLNLINTDLDSSLISTFIGSVNRITSKNTTLSIIANPIDVKVNDKITITGTLKDENQEPLSDKTIIITVDGNSLEPILTDENGDYTTEYTTTKSGSLTITAKFDIEGDYTYSSSTAETTVDVSKLMTQLEVETSETVVNPGDKITITGTLKDENNELLDSQQITIEIGDFIDSVVTDNGMFTYEYTVESVSTNEVIIRYEGNDVYDSSDASINLEVTKIDTTLTVSVSEDTVDPGVTVTITGILMDSEENPIADQDLTITIDNLVDTISTDSEGAYSYTYTPETEGIATVVVNYAGDNRYEQSDATTSFNVVESHIDTTIIVSDVTEKYGRVSEITATITDANGNAVEDGCVAFKLNSVTIKNEDGNSMLVDVVDGVATLNYTIINNVGTYTISATYSGSDSYKSSRTLEDAILTVEPRTVDLTISTLTEDLKAGDTVLFTVIVSDEYDLIDGGIVIFKLNGVTLKNADGGNLNATVVDSVATVEYTIPVDYAAKEYILTAVYSNNNYERTEANTTISLIRSNVTAVLEPITIVQGENATIRLILYDQNNNQLERSTKVAVKVNGKTFTNTNTTNGVLDVTLDTSDFKNQYYNLTVVLGENSAYNELRLESVIIVEPTTVTTYSTTIKTEPSIEPITTTDIIGLEVSSNSNGTIIKE